MRWRKQLEFIFQPFVVAASLREACRYPGAERVPQGRGYRRDHALVAQARELLRSLGADKLAHEIRVEWNPRLKTCAGRADYLEKLISLNPLLLCFDNRLALNESVAEKLDRLNRSSLPRAASAPIRMVCDEIDRTLRHELAHLLAQWRVGRRRIAPHGEEWRRACRDLGIADEARCHNLPFASKSFPPRYVYRCPNCKEKFPRVRRIRRAVACLSCCRAHNRGEFDARFRLRLISNGACPPSCRAVAFGEG